MNNSFVQEQSNNRSLMSTYLWLSIGLVVSGVTSTFMYTSGMYFQLITSGFAWILFIAQFGLVIAFSAMMNRLSVNALRALYIGYAVTLGISLTSIFYQYSLSLIGVAFFVSAGYYICLVLIGLTTKRDLSKLGTMSFAALLALIVSQIVFMIFRVSVSTQVMSILGLLIFTGLTAFDVQRANVILSNAEDGSMTQQKWSIYFALQLYLDFINIFLYILRILGSKKN